MSEVLAWIQQLQSIAQSGLAYSTDSFDQKRFGAIQNIAVEMLANVAAFGPDRAKDVFFEDKGYRTPKIDVRGGIFAQNKILLVKERADGLWTLPGGWADVNESPRQAIEREVLEETGLTVRASKLTAIHDINIHQPGQFYHSYKLFFLCDWSSGALSSTDETADAGYFSLQNLPALSLRRATAGQIALLFDHYSDASLPTAFD